MDNDHYEYPEQTSTNKHDGGEVEFWAERLEMLASSEGCGAGTMQHSASLLREQERALAESLAEVRSLRETVERMGAEIGPLKIRAERLAGAASNVLAHVEGSQPVAGWLRDNDASRTALTELRAALEQGH